MTSRPTPSPGMRPMWREREARAAIFGSCRLYAVEGSKELRMVMIWRQISWLEAGTECEKQCYTVLKVLGFMILDDPNVNGFRKLTLSFLKSMHFTIASLEIRLC